MDPLRTNPFEVNAFTGSIEKAIDDRCNALEAKYSGEVLRLQTQLADEKLAQRRKTQHLQSEINQLEAQVQSLQSEWDASRLQVTQLPNAQQQQPARRRRSANSGNGSTIPELFIALPTSLPDEASSSSRVPQGMPKRPRPEPTVVSRKTRRTAHRSTSQAEPSDSTMTTSDTTPSEASVLVYMHRRLPAVRFPAALSDDTTQFLAQNVAGLFVANENKPHFSTTNTAGCVAHAAKGQGELDWTREDPGHRTCKQCANSRLLCIRKYEDGEHVALPLPESLRVGVDPFDLAYWIYHGTGTLSRKMPLWE